MADFSKMTSADFEAHLNRREEARAYRDKIKTKNHDDFLLKIGGSHLPLSSATLNPRDLAEKIARNMLSGQSVSLLPPVDADKDPLKLPATGKGYPPSHVGLINLVEDLKTTGLLAEKDVKDFHAGLLNKGVNLKEMMDPGRVSYTRLKTGEDIPIPPQMQDFCRRAGEGAQCSDYKGSAAPLVWTLELFEKLQKVNDDVNREVFYNSDKNLYGKDDHWAYPKEFKMSSRYEKLKPQSKPRFQGDCEDSALEKIKRLKALGVPEDRLSIAIVAGDIRQPQHAVVVARTNVGDLVLDINDSRIRDASEKTALQGYRFEAMQKPGNPKEWVTINGFEMGSAKKDSMNPSAEAAAKPERHARLGI